MPTVKWAFFWGMIMESKSEEEKVIDFDLAEYLGSESASRKRISIYIPDKNFDGEQVVGIDKWIEDGLTALEKVNGGASAILGIRGRYRNKKGKSIRETTAIVYSYIFDADLFLNNFHEIRKFVHDFGRVTQQEEVVVEFDDEFHKVTVYDLPQIPQIF